MLCILPAIPTELHTLHHVSEQWRDPGGGRNRRAPPLNFDRLCLCIQFCIRILQNKAQIAYERASETVRASRAPIGRPWP